MAENKVKNTTQKIEEPQVNETKEKDETQELKDQLAAALEAIKELQKQVAQGNTAQPNITLTVPSTDVTLVYLSDSPGNIHAGNAHLTPRGYGEKFRVARSDFDAICGLYKTWFDAGILAVSDDDVEVAVAKNIRTESEFALSSRDLARLGTMSAKELEELWNKTIAESQKASICTYFKRKIIEGDSNFRDREKVDLLNRLTNGGFNRESEELGGLNLKIKPTEIELSNKKKKN